jgi:outer membrane protein
MLRGKLFLIGRRTVSTTFNEKADAVAEPVDLVSGAGRNGHMTRVRTTLGRRRRRVWLLVIGALAGQAAGSPAIADPLSDPFQTGASLQQRTSGLTDPLGRECAAPAGALSLPAAVDLALCRNPSTRAAWAAAHQQAAALGVADSAWVPSLSVTGSGTRTFGAHTDAAGNTVSTPQSTGDAALNLSWTLYDFGARGGRTTSASRMLDAAAATANSVSQQTVLNVVQSFYGVVAADADLVAAKTAEAAYGRSLEVARARREGGAATQADVLQAETAFHGAELMRVQAETVTKSSRGTLAVTLGSSADQQLTLDAEAVPAEAPALTAKMADLMAEAVRQRPDLAAARAQRDAAEADVVVARAAGRPTISLGAGTNFIATTGIPHQHYNMVGITVTMPVFTGFNVTYGIRQAQAILEGRAASAEQVRLSVSLDVWNGYHSLESANQQLTVTAALIKSAEENEQVALGRYQAGVGTIIDVLTAQSAAATARQQRVGAELGWRVARAQLALALGRLSSAEPLTGTSVSR